MKPVYRVVATIGDPRSETCGAEVNGLTIEGGRRAIELADVWSDHGYWTSVYCDDGECVYESPLP